MIDPSDDRSAIARALTIVSMITTVALEMVLPVLGGLWVDQKLGCRPLLTIVGGAGGLALGIWQLIRLSSSSPGRFQ